MIRRGPRKERDFTVLSNTTVRDARLSWRARGLLAFLLSQPPDYRVRSTELADLGTEGREAIRTALGELETAGYLVRQKIRRPDGTFEHEAVVYDEPQPSPENPSLAPPAETDESPGGTGAQESGAGILGPLRNTENEELEVPTTSVEPKLDAGPAPVREVFEAWLASTGRSGRTVLDDRRRRLITKALARYPLSDVLDAVRGWEHSAFHRGHNARRRPFNDLGLLLRDSEHIEGFRDAARGPREPDPGPGGRPRPAIDAVMKDRSQPSGRVIL